MASFTRHRWTGQFYVKCEGGLDCCYSGPEHHARPDVKKWDIGQSKPGGFLNDTVTHLGTRKTTNLDGPVTADAWLETFNLPFTHTGVNYTYFITKAANGDVITQRIDFGVKNNAKATGTILYGDFEVQHNITSFRDVFEGPAACLKPNTFRCASDKVAEWDAKYGF